MHHFKNNYKTYKKLNHSDSSRVVSCGLCENVSPDSVIEEVETMRVVRNRMPYDMFDGLRTTGEHYMIVPKRHLLTFDDFTDAEKLDHINLIAKYEKIGFSVYARSHTNTQRSQPHQHTHLLELTDDPKPYPRSK